MSRANSHTSDGYWLPWDSKNGERKTYFSHQYLHDLTYKVPARHVAIISDSCFSGRLLRNSGTGVEDIPQRKESWFVDAWMRRSREVFTSGSDHPVSDDGPGGHSRFCNRICDFIRVTRDSFFTLTEIRSAIQPLINDQRICYSPLTTSDAHDNGEMIFCGANLVPQFTRSNHSGNDSAEQVPASDHFKVLCYESDRWQRYPSAKMTCQQTSDFLEVENTTYIHRHAIYIFNQLLTSDFEVRIRFSGQYSSIQFVSDSGRDEMIYCDPADQGVDTTVPCTISVRRKDGVIAFLKEDGSQLYRNNWQAREDMCGYVGFALHNAQSIRIYQWKVTIDAPSD